MTSLTFEVYTNPPDWQDLNQWRQVLPSQDAILLDPATGDALHPEVPHRCLLEDARLNEGYGYLERERQNINMRVFYGRHKLAGDLGPEDEGWFEQQVAGSDVYAFEQLGWDRAEYLNSLDRYFTAGIDPPLSDSFSARRWRAIVQSNAITFSHDVEHTGGELDTMITDMFSLWRKSPQRNGLNMERTERWDWAYIYACIKQWYMVGKLGYELSKLGPNKPLGRPLNVFMTVGSLHRDLTRKFGLLGVQVSEAIAAGPLAGNASPNDGFVQVASSGLIRAGARRAAVKVPAEAVPSLPDPDTPAEPESRVRVTSIGEVGMTLATTFDMLPAEGFDAAIAEIDSRISQLQAAITDTNHAQIETRIDYLRQAQYHLAGARDGLGCSRARLQQMLSDWGVVEQ